MIVRSILKLLMDFQLRWTKKRGATQLALTTSSAHTHEREEDLQAASSKLDRPLFETQIRLSVAGPEGAADAPTLKIRPMAGTFGLFSSTRLAAFHLSPIKHTTSRPQRWQRPAFLLSTEEL